MSGSTKVEDILNDITEVQDLLKETNDILQDILMDLQKYDPDQEEVTSE